MTQLVLNYSTSLLESIWAGLKNTLKGMMLGLVLARQSSANRVVAQQLIDVGEYRQDDYFDLVHQLNVKTLSDLRKEFS